MTFISKLVPTRSECSNHNDPNDPRHGLLWYDTQCHYSNFHQGCQNQDVQDPETWTLTYLLQLKQECKKLVDEFNCVIEESYTVQDPSVPPSDILLLSPLTRLHSDTGHNQVLPQPGESRPVLSPFQRKISRQLMRDWEPWKTNIDSSPNTRIVL